MLSHVNRTSFNIAEYLATQ